MHATPYTAGQTCIILIKIVYQFVTTQFVATKQSSSIWFSFQFSDIFWDGKLNSVEFIFVLADLNIQLKNDHIYSIDLLLT